MTITVTVATDTFGLSAYGFGVPAPLTIIDAYATSLRSIRVRFTRALDEATATNPTTWTVTLDDGTTLLVEIGVLLVLGYQVEVFLLEKLPPFPRTLSIAARYMRDSEGVLILATKDSYSVDLTGMAYASLEQDQQTVDLSNPPLGAVNSPPGALHVGSGGDYDEDSGTEFLRKLVFRRLTTGKGEFFHLPNYGIGLKVKEPLTSTDLVRLRSDIQLQILAEPEFDSAAVALSMATNGVLTVSVHAILTKTQTVMTVTFDVPTALVSL